MYSYLRAFSAALVGPRISVAHFEDHLLTTLVCYNVPAATAIFDTKVRVEDHCTSNKAASYDDDDDDDGNCTDRRR